MADHTPLEAQQRTAANPSPADVVRFLCDGMLARLCRRLRAAGYDTKLAGPSEHDRALLERAVAEDRLLLTCDRKMAERRLAPGRVIVLPSNGLDGTARALMESVPIDWLLAPFSRCLIDNSPLRPASTEELDRLPVRARVFANQEVVVCPRCDRIYWPGSHKRRMHEKLCAWQAALGAEPGGVDSL